MALLYSGHHVSAVTSMEREFIEKYKELQLLWKRDNPDYVNKFKRNLAYDELLVILRKLLPSANRYSVRQKINILRSVYRKEVKRFLQSKTITSEGELVHTYKPSSWKFEAMKFLLDQDELNEYESENDSKMEIPQCEIEEETVEDETFNDMEEPELIYIEDMTEETENDDTGDLGILENPVSPVYAVPKKPIIIKRARKRSKYEIGRNISNGHNVSNQSNLSYASEQDIMDQECSAVGSNVTCKLQRMNIEQRLYAEQLIHKILVRGLQMTLSNNTDFTDTVQYYQKSEIEEEHSNRTFS